MEEAEGLRNMMEKLGITQAEVAKKMGMSKTAVSNALRLLNLPDSIRKFVEKGDMTMGQVRPLFGVGDENRMLWWLSLSGIVSVLRHNFSQKRLKLVNEISGFIILGFGIFSLTSI